MSFRRPARRTSPASRRHLPRLLAQGFVLTAPRRSPPVLSASDGYSRPDPSYAVSLDLCRPEGQEDQYFCGRTIPQAVAVARGKDRHAASDWVPGEASRSTFAGSFLGSW